MPAGMGILGAEGRAERIDIAQGAGERLAFELAGDRQIGLFREEIGGPVDLPLRRTCGRGRVEGRHPEEFAGALAIARGDDRRGLIPNMTSIDERPLEVDERLVPEHWEGGLIKGARNRSQVGTLVERTTLFTVLAHMQDATALGAANAFSTVLNKVDAQMRLSLTYDQGREMAAHQHLTHITGMQVYFAHPHSPWERGINENTNGLLRQYLPKGEDLSVYTQEDLDKIAWRLNTRPRKSLAWKCPAELFLPEDSFDFQAYWKSILQPNQPNVALGA